MQDFFDCRANGVHSARKNEISEYGADNHGDFSRFRMKRRHDATRFGAAANCRAAGARFKCVIR
ncbi:hypothetical protein ACMHYJ_07280 [Castellaniella hirudinis]|uniref:hypothetical protein n=1 Tax=Castellaniella hirudinis TaxID=1144617 RepID=UPI0039C34404